MGFRLEWHSKEPPAPPNLDKAQQFVDSEVLRRCQPYVPMDRGTLIKSGVLNTKIGSGQVIYKTPYARRWYFESAHFQHAPMRGNQWFERMKQNGGAKQILDAAQRIIDGG